MGRIGAGLVSAGLLAGGVGGAQAVEWRDERGAALALAASALDQTGGLDAEPLLARADIYWERTGLFANGLEAGLSLGAAAARDHPARDPRAGAGGACPPQEPACPNSAGEPVRAPVSGLVSAGPAADRGVRGEVETAYLFLRGPWGEGSLGRDQGAGDRFSLPPPTILRAVGLADATLDPTGFGAIVLRNDLSGFSAKASYVSPRLLGFSAGLSYTPRFEGRGLDQGARAGAAPDPEDTLEAGLSFARTWRSGWETQSALTYSTADGGARAGFDRIESASAGIQIGREGWRLGASGLVSDNGWAAGDAPYAAYGASASWARAKWAFMAGVARARDDLVGVDTHRVLAGARFSVTDQFSVALAGLAGGRAIRGVAQGRVDKTEERTQGLVAEFLFNL